jgi:hypothetical protein
MPHPKSHAGALTGTPPRRAAVRCEAKPEGPLLGALILAVAGVWIAVPALALVEGRAALPNLGVGGSCSLIAVGIAQLLWGLHVLLRRRTLTVGENALQIAERGLLGVRRWQEPLAHFRGLRHRRQRVHGRRGWKVVHRLELVHPEPSKAVCLLSSRDERRIAAAARKWARCLGLPTTVEEPPTPAPEPGGGRPSATSSCGGRTPARPARDGCAGITPARSGRSGRNGRSRRSPPCC